MDEVTEILEKGAASVAADIDDIRRSIEGLRSEIKSMLATYNANNVEVQQGLVGSKRWQEAHEKLDEERWEGIREKLAELKGMLETIPVKVGEDIRDLREADKKLWQKLDEHSNTITMLKGVWLALSIGIPGLIALFEIYMHMKGGS